MESKKIKRLMCSVITATLLLCELPGVAPMMESVGVVQEVEAASRKLSSTKVSVMTGEKSKITLKGVSSKKKKSVKWKSNSKNLVVSYSKKDTRSATFYARKAGTYKVTATYGKKTYVAVVKASKKGMSVTSRTLNKGQQYTLKLKGVKGKAKWSSSKKSVVTVKTIKNGKSAVITAKKPGSATITATVGEKKLVCVVKVKGTAAVVTPKPNPTTAPKPTESPKPQPTEAPKPTDTPSPSPNPTETPSPTPTPVVVPATGIKLDDTKISLDVECPTWELSCKVEPKNSTQKDVVWESDNTKVVTVSNYGELTAIGNGTAKVRCYLKENRSIYAECVVTVDLSSKEPETKPEPTKPVEPKPEPTKPVDPKPTEPEVVKVSGITLNPDINLKIEEGNSSKITATVVPSNATNSSVKWVSSSPDVATVDDNGNVTAIKAGSTDITCTAVDGSGVSAVCPVTVTAKSTTTNPSEQDKTDPTYTFKVRGGSLKSKSTFNGGDLANILITTDAPMDKLMITTSNNSIQYNALSYDSQYDYYSFSLYARKKTDACKVDITVNGKSVWSKVVSVSSDDKNWITYDAWLNKVISDINSDGSWNSADNLHKILLVGQYILDNYSYDYNPMSAFHLNGKGNCNASANVLADVATRLGLRADVVTPKAYVVNNPSHVVAKVWYNNVAYLIEAGYEGQAGNRGTVTCIKASEQK